MRLTFLSVSSHRVLGFPRYHPHYAVPATDRGPARVHGPPGKERGVMSVKYLSDEWAKEVTDRLQNTEAVTKTIKGQNFVIQQVVTDVPDRGEVKFYARAVDGVPEVALGEAEGPDATISQSYDVSVGIDKGELNPQAAFMQGKVTIQGNIMKMLQLQGFVSSLVPAMAGLEREY
jgi:putative sterol carrier protein